MPRREGVWALRISPTGTATTSDLVFVNVAPQPVRPALYFYDKAGQSD